MKLNEGVTWQHSDATEITVARLKQQSLFLLCTTAPAAGSYPQQQHRGTSQANPPQYCSVRPPEMQQSFNDL